MTEMAPMDGNKSMGVQQARVVWIYMNIWSYFFNVLPNFTLKTFLRCEVYL
jgi:hypothetical protein